MPTKWFVHWECGSCQAGDRNGGLIECDSLQEALEMAKEVRAQNDYGVSLTIIEGVEVEETQP